MEGGEKRGRRGQDERKGTDQRYREGKREEGMKRKKK